MSSRESHYNWNDIAARAILMGFKLIGLAPFSALRTTERPYTTSETLKNSTFFKFSYFGCVYNLCLIIIHCGILCVAIPTLLRMDYVNRSSFTELVDFVVTIIGNITLFVIWLTITLQQKTAVRLLNELLNSDSVTPFLKPDSSSRFIAIACTANIAIWIAMITSSVLGFRHSLLNYLAYTVTFKICCLFVFQYTFTVKLIENRFAALNRALLERPILSSADIQDGLFPAKKISEHDSPELKITTMRRTCAVLCDTASGISDFYSTPILLTIATLSITILYCSYYVIVPFVTPLKRPQTMIYINSILWLIGLSLPIVLLASGVGNVAGEIKKTTDIVRKLLIVSSITSEDNIELNRFFLELLNRKVEFTACGLFSLDCTILLSIFSMVCTYLIILLQLQMG